MIDKLQDMFYKTQIISYIRIMSGCQETHVRKKNSKQLLQQLLFFFFNHNRVMRMIRLYGSPVLTLGLTVMRTQRPLLMTKN